MNINQKSKPKYNMLQNCWYMLKIALQNHPSVPCLCLAVTTVSVLSSLAELLVVPILLEKVESRVPLDHLIAVILFFSMVLLLLATLKAYLDANVEVGRYGIRNELMNLLNHKAMETSYPHQEDPEFMTFMQKAYDATSMGEISATQRIWYSMTDLLTNFICFVIYLVLLKSLDFWLILMVLATTANSYAANSRVKEWVYRNRSEGWAYQKKIHYVRKRAEDRVYAKDIRIFGMKQWLNDVHDRTLNLYEAFIYKREKKYLQVSILDAVLTFLRNGIAYWYLITMAISENWSVSQFLLYFTAIGSFTTWILGILNHLSTLRQHSEEVGVMREFLEVPEPFLFEEGKALEVSADAAYELTLKNVSFRYPGAENDTIHRMNLTIKPGEKLAIVGLNGAGKTTLVKLLCGFYDPTEGQVLLNDSDIRQYNRRDYYRLFGAVFQQFSILSTNFAENVAQSVDHIDEERVMDCLKKAGLAEKIKSLPQGMYTHTGRSVFEDGVELSGGEMQRLMLARALYKNAPIIVLDEPTAALDPIAENDIYMKYNEMCRERSSIFISHRLASTRFCDRIIYLKNGKILEEGTHNQLIEFGGRYADLFQIQSQYYREGGEENGEKTVSLI